MQTAKNTRVVSAFLIIGAAIFALVFSGCNSAKSVSTDQNNSNAVAAKSPPSGVSQPIEMTDALQRLKEGNARFVTGKSIHPDLETLRRSNLKTGQKPFAVILGCSDSRVPPELVFDQGLGDVFVARVAGNIFDDAVDGSVEYAVEHLGAELIVVMGHESCGAVTAAIENNREAHIKFLAEAIKPAIVEAMKLPGDKIDNAVRANVEYVVAQIRRNEPILSKKIAENKLRVVGAYYDLDSGEVTFIP